MGRRRSEVIDGQAGTWSALMRATGIGREQLRRYARLGVISDGPPWDVADVVARINAANADGDAPAGNAEALTFNAAAEKLRWDAVKAKEQALKAQREREALEGLYVLRERHETALLARTRRFVASIAAAGARLGPVLVGVESASEAARIIDDYFRSVRAQLAASYVDDDG